MYPTTALVPLILIPVLSLARDVTFPSLAAAHTHQIPIIYSGEHDLNDIDIITGSEFAGLTTFANLPYASCFSVDEGMKGEEERECDVAFLGAPFDTVSWVLFIHHLVGGLRVLLGKPVVAPTPLHNSIGILR